MHISPILACKRIISNLQKKQKSPKSKHCKSPKSRISASIAHRTAYGGARSRCAVPWAVLAKGEPTAPRPVPPWIPLLPAHPEKERISRWPTRSFPGWASTAIVPQVFSRRRSFHPTVPPYGHSAYRPYEGRRTAPNLRHAPRHSPLRDGARHGRYIAGAWPVTAPSFRAFGAPDRTVCRAENADFFLRQNSGRFGRCFPSLLPAYYAGRFHRPFGFPKTASGGGQSSSSC